MRETLDPGARKASGWKDRKEVRAHDSGMDAGMRTNPKSSLFLDQS